MSGDWLEEARRAARDVGEAKPGDAARTRARVARTVARRARGRWRAPWIGLAAAALVGGTAWASGAEGTRVVAWIRAQVAGEPAKAVSAAALPAAPPATPASTVPGAASPVAAPAAAPSVLASSEARLLLARPAPPAPLPGRERGDGVASEGRLYAKAHALHFVDHDPSRALVAWERYLAVAPDDTRAGLVLEARYNRAICLVRLGRRDEARAALAPFAGGAYGGYRQEDARTLLDAAVLRVPAAVGDVSDDDAAHKTF